MNIKRLEKKVNYIIKFLEKKLGIKNINRTEFIKDIYYLNKLIHDFYLISKSDMTREEKIQKLSNQKTPNGEILVDKETAEVILNKYSKNIVDFYDRLYFSDTNKKGGSPENTDREICTKTHNSNLDEYIKNIHSHSFNSLGKVNKTVLDLKNKVVNMKLDNIIPKPISKVGMFMINWMFFPLWSMENLPLVGRVITVPLDIMGLVIDNFDVMMENMGSTITMVIDILLDILQGIPVAGTAVSAIALPLNILEKPIEYAIENGTDVIGMFFNLSRKQFGLAYVSSLSAIPYLTDIVDAMVTNLSTANKFIANLNKGLSKINVFTDKANNIMNSITENAKKYSSMFDSILANPEVLYKPELIISKLIIPIKDQFEFLDGIDNKTLVKMSKQIMPLLKKFVKEPFYYISNTEKIYDDIIKPYKNDIEFLKNLSKHEINEKLFKIINLAIKGVNHEVDKYTKKLTKISLGRNDDN